MSDNTGRLNEIRERYEKGYMDYARVSREDYLWLLAEIARLQAIVDKLPKTADGVLIEYGDTVWVRNQETGKYEDDLCFYNPGWTNDDGDFQWVHVQDCYSTPEAAEQAKETK